VLVIFSFSASNRASVWGGFSTRWYAGLAENADLVAALANSLAIGLAVAGLSTMLGTVTAMGLAGSAGSRTARVGEVAVAMPIAVPDVVQGISLLLAFKLIWFALVEALFATRPSLGRGTVIAAHTAYAFAYVTIVVRARLVGMGRTIEEAAADLGATPLVAFFRVTLPLLWPAVVGGFLLAFTLSLDEFVITFFTSGTQGATLPVYIWSRVRYGVSPEINALSAVLVAASIALVAASVLLQRRR
jgi:ABC-type spermidine/putrescine transport system permease subunit II